MDCGLYSSKHCIEQRKNSCGIADEELAEGQVAGYFSHINSMLWILKFTALNMSIEFLYLICLCDIIYDLWILEYSRGSHPLCQFYHSVLVNLKFLQVKINIKYNEWYHYMKCWSVHVAPCVSEATRKGYKDHVTHI